MTNTKMKANFAFRKLTFDTSYNLDLLFVQYEMDETIHVSERRLSLKSRYVCLIEKNFTPSALKGNLGHCV